MADDADDRQFCPGIRGRRSLAMHVSSGLGGHVAALMALHGAQSFAAPSLDARTLDAAIDTNVKRVTQIAHATALWMPADGRPGCIVNIASSLASRGLGTLAVDGGHLVSSL